ncbi:hypothetical protein [Paramicrobacterium agarici]|uniref:hypothetical protein n=1 Tax=Paramicrobacterium agarici TaxID=630514 RepID=UPI001150B943|nr:hypothetical protein [Microbacterium agarici]TQO22852.1 hypothetical protein FB385_1692 [Microbacterium agarici]
MDTTRTHTPPRTRSTPLTRSLYIGLALQILCIGIPLLDLLAFNTIESQVQAAYPDWSGDQVQLDTTAIAIGLAIITALGILAWAVALLVTRRGRFGRSTVTTMFIIGLCVAGSVIGMGGGAYERFAPLWISLTLFIVPLLPGLTALVAAWHPPTTRDRAVA